MQSYMQPAARTSMLHLSPLPKVVSLSVDNQATICSISRPGYSYQVPPPPRHRKSRIHPAPLGFSSPNRVDTVIQAPWATSSLTLPQNLLSRATLPTTSCPHAPTPTCALRYVADFSRSGRSGKNQETTSRSPPPQSSPLSSPSLATRLFQMKLAASYLLDHPNWHRPDLGFAHSVFSIISNPLHAARRAVAAARRCPRGQQQIFSPPIETEVFAPSHCGSYWGPQFSYYPNSPNQRKRKGGRSEEKERTKERNKRESGLRRARPALLAL